MVSTASHQPSDGGHQLGGALFALLGGRAENAGASAVRIDLAAETFSFCTRHCAHAFAANPQQHLASDPSGSPAAATQSRV